MHPPYRNALVAMSLVSVACLLLYGSIGQPKPMAIWNWVDIVGEGGTALMSALWTLLILGSRPGGRVTLLLTGGLSAIMLGAWVDCLDEFFKIPDQHVWDSWLESLLTFGGMLTLTLGLYFWRQEQWSLNEHMQKRERLFREHRSFDRITQLANADYLRHQLRIEQERHPGSSALILLDVDDFHLINREQGQQEGNRLLQAISHLLLLNLRPEDLLCRYAGDRYAILMPEASAATAAAAARHLQQALRSLAHHTRAGTRLRLSGRVVWAVLSEDTDALLSRLDQALEGEPSSAEGGAAVAA
jgi:diguanylate cyclase (GGDEF)-like protein